MKRADTVALVAGLLVGGYVYARKSSEAEASLRAGPCASAPPGSLQSLAQAIQGAKSHFGEDLALGSLGLVDLLVKLQTFGLVTTDTAADFYSWWHGLTPEQQAAVRVTEDGNLTCAAAETGAQLASGGEALVDALLAGLVAYVGVSVATTAEEVVP